METKIHYGLDVAQYKQHVNPDAKNIDLLVSWARDMIKAYEVEIDSVNYGVLLEAPEHFEVTDFQERQAYFRIIFMECLGNS